MNMSKKKFHVPSKEEIEEHNRKLDEANKRLTKTALSIIDELGLSLMSVYVMPFIDGNKMLQGEFRFFESSEEQKQMARKELQKLEEKPSGFIVPEIVLKQNQGFVKNSKLIQESK